MLGTEEGRGKTGDGQISPYLMERSPKVSSSHLSTQSHSCYCTAWSKDKRRRPSYFAVVYIRSFYPIRRCVVYIGFCLPGREKKE
jgi:hypothetical protein